MFATLEPIAKLSVSELSLWYCCFNVVNDKEAFDYTTNKSLVFLSIS